MRVLHVFKWYDAACLGGTERVIQQLITATSRLGVINSVLCIARDGAGSGAVVEGVGAAGEKIYTFPPSWSGDSLAFSGRMFRNFPRLAAEHDLVHYHFPFPQQDLLHLLGRPALPSLLSYHSDIVRQRWLYFLYRPLMYSFLRRVDALVASSPQYLASSPVLRRFAAKTMTIPYGLDETTYPQSSAENEDVWRRRLGDNFFLFLGVLRYYKGLEILLRAAGMTPQQRFVIAGSGPLEAKLRGLAAEMGLANVHFVGAVSEEDKVTLLRLCCGFVFPSHLRSEAFGVSLLEAAMFGNPLISAEIGTGTSYVNLADVTGLVVPPADPVALARAVDTLAADPALASRFGDAARQRYREIFTAERFGAAYVGLYKKLISWEKLNKCRL